MDSGPGEQLLLIAATPITYEEFLSNVHRERSGTLSQSARPVGGGNAWRADCSIREFLAVATHPVWYTAPDGTGHAPWDRQDSRRILFRDALQLPDFCATFLENRHRDSRTLDSGQAIVLHCSACGHAAVIDGNHC